MIVTSFEQWREWAGRYTILPYIRKYSLQEEPIGSWEGAWKAASGCSFVLESGKEGRYSFLGLHPVSTIKGKGNTAIITYLDSGRTVRETVNGAPLALVKRWMSRYKAPKVENAPKFAGGCVGYWGYDVARSIENIPETAADDLGLPDYYFMMTHELWIVDRRRRELYCAVHVPWTIGTANDEGELRRNFELAGEWAEHMKRLWDGFCSPEAAESRRRREAVYERLSQQDRLHIDVEAFAGVRPEFEKARFIDAVRRIQQYIGQGDVFQVNLSVRQSRRLHTSPEDIYEWLRLMNPSPYMGMLRFPEFSLVSASPELLVKLEGDKVQTRPIAGTRPRGKNEEEDLRLAEELLQSEKERAEHVMLVDLERNDLGRISRYGSVKVNDFMVIERYSHVMHIVSGVEGLLADGKDAFDVIAAAFPGGTITGAPKVRTMQIIEELEPVRRGPYTGSMGWIDYNGNMEFNIIIRTLLAYEGFGYVQAGAGIVIDSDPEKEYGESLNKAKALWKAVQYSEQMRSGEEISI